MENHVEEAKKLLAEIDAVRFSESLKAAITLPPGLHDAMHRLRTCEREEVPDALSKFKVEWQSHIDAEAKKLAAAAQALPQPDEVGLQYPSMRKPYAPKGSTHGI